MNNNKYLIAVNAREYLLGYSGTKISCTETIENARMFSTKMEADLFMYNVCGKENIIKQCGVSDAEQKRGFPRIVHCDEVGKIDIEGPTTFVPPFID